MEERLFKLLQIVFHLQGHPQLPGLKSWAMGQLRDMENGVSSPQLTQEYKRTALYEADGTAATTTGANEPEMK